MILIMIEIPVYPVEACVHLSPTCKWYLEDCAREEEMYTFTSVHQIAYYRAAHRMVWKREY
ncbi:unnamed protein product [marine sediment metagenome]|uniref:Uncharacterized protein n=1 Tax=marine sediment metagenome TaxID=412755 RepID=X0UMG1_9ZZZZ